MKFVDKLDRALRIMGKAYLRDPYKRLWEPSCPVTGYCYVVSELVYHELGIKGIRTQPYYMRIQLDVETPDGPAEGTHWFLKTEDGKILDYTRDQFRVAGSDPVQFDIDYSKGIKAGFLTKEPSRRCRVLLNLLRSLSGQAPRDQYEGGKSRQAMKRYAKKNKK